VSQVLAGCCCTAQGPCACCAPSAVQITWPTINIDVRTQSSVCGSYVTRTLTNGTAIMQRCCTGGGRIDHYQTAPLMGNGLAKMGSCFETTCLDVPWGAVISLVANCRARPGASPTGWGIYVHYARFECIRFPGTCSKTSGTIKPDGYKSPGWVSCVNYLYGTFDQTSYAASPIFTCPSGYVPGVDPDDAAFRHANIDYPNNKHTYFLDNGNVCNPLGTYASGWIVS
jgi:hypothetical protein